MNLMRAMAVMILLACPAAPAFAQQASTTQPGGDAGRVEPELAADAEVVAALAKLGDNQSAVLPPIKAVGEWNDITREFSMHLRGPQGRDYTNKAVWMPDRKRAFFCGANHGSPHRLNDAWEYDLPSNTWVMLFAPERDGAAVRQIATGEVRDADGKVIQKVRYVQTKRGGPTHFGHTWWAFSYDPKMKAALWMNVAIGQSPARYIEQSTGSADDIYRGPPMWAFYPYEKQWRMILSPQPVPKVGYAKQMEYVPELGGSLLMSGDWDGVGDWLYDGKTNTWTRLNAKSAEAPSNESLTCYVPDLKIMVGQSPSRSTHHYDIATRKWTKVLDPGKDNEDAPIGHDARSQMYYDPVNKVCLLYESRRPDGIWAYSPAEKKWTRHTADGAPAPGTRRVISYFDEARNVFVVNLADKTWVYRYGNKK